jgi:hypothetical protein
MNSIKQVTSGLSSSLFLAVGLTRLAEKTDPMFNRNAAALTKVQHADSSAFSTLPCQFAPQTGQ